VVSKYTFLQIEKKTVVLLQHDAFKAMMSTVTDIYCELLLDLVSSVRAKSLFSGVVDLIGCLLYKGHQYLSVSKCELV